MRIVCSHDEASLLKIVCHKHAICAKCALEPFCHRKDGRSSLDKLVYKNPQTAVLITKQDAQVIKGVSEHEAGSSGYTETYTVTLKYDGRGHLIDQDGHDMSAIPADADGQDWFIV